MAAAMLNFSSSEEDDDRMEEKQKEQKKTQFKQRKGLLKFKRKHDVVKKVSKTPVPPQDEDVDMEEDVSIVIKKSSVKFQPKPKDQRPKDGYADLLSMYGHPQREIRPLVTKDESDAAEGFYLDPESDDEDHHMEDVDAEKLAETPSPTGMARDIDLDVREVEIQMLNEEFIPQGLESRKKSRQVLERDTVALQLDDGGYMANDVTDTATDVHAAEKAKREMIQRALEEENAVEGTGAMTILMSTPHLHVRSPVVPPTQDVVARLRGKVSALAELLSKQQSKLAHFKLEREKLRAVERS